jgi:hypothetical protein
MFRILFAAALVLAAPAFAANVLLDGNGAVIGTFGSPQPGYPGFAVIPDDDQRIATFAAKQAQPGPPSPRAWLERLSPTTQGNITKAALADSSGAMLLWLLKASGNPQIDVTSAETIAGVNAMVGAGVLTSAEAATLLAP